MYKGASRNAVWRTAVDRAHPSRGYIDGGPDAADVLPDVSHLSHDEMLAEKKDLAARLGQVHAGIAAAKATGQARQLAMLGQQHQTLQSRAAAINLRLKSEQPPRKANDPLAEAVRQICDAETQARIFRRARELHRGGVQ